MWRIKRLEPGKLKRTNNCQQLKTRATKRTTSHDRNHEYRRSVEAKDAMLQENRGKLHDEKYNTIQKADACSIINTSHLRDVEHHHDYHLAALTFNDSNAHAHGSEWLNSSDPPTFQALTQASESALSSMLLNPSLSWSAKLSVSEHTDTSAECLRRRSFAGLVPQSHPAPQEPSTSKASGLPPVELHEWEEIARNASMQARRMSQKACELDIVAGVMIF